MAETFPNYGGTIKGGFYYDVQKNNPLMSVTLHANYETDDGGITWYNWSKGDLDKDGGYGLDPLCTALMSEDFGVSIANNWSEFDAGNMLESAWNSVRPAGAYLGHASKLMSGMVEAGNKWLSKNAEGSTEWARRLNSGLSKVNDFISSDKTKILNHALVVQGTRFSYYAGTGTSFSNLNMKFTLFADYVHTVDRASGKDTVTEKLVSVHEQLKDLYPYIMGQYVSVDGSNGSGKESSNSLNEFFGWQKAPGGFTPDIKNIDNPILGTLKLKFGSYYSIRNLVVRDAQLNFSKQMVKDPNNPGTVTPLYCDVMLSFQPATKFSDVALRAFCEGEKTKTIEQKALKTRLDEGLTNAKKGIKEVIDKYTK